jgi:hypothetical protein
MHSYTWDRIEVDAAFEASTHDHSDDIYAQ